MRVCVVVSLALALLLLSCVTGHAAQAGSPDGTDRELRSPTDSVPVHMLWPYGMLTGYISITLKDQLRRRGHLSGRRDRTFADLISLGRGASQQRKTQSDRDSRGTP